MFKKLNLLKTTLTVIAAAFIVLSGPIARADVIFVSGDVTGVWSADSVIVTDSVCVPAGESLTIMPGVQVLFTSYYKFEVIDGAVLHAVGTELDPIGFLPFTEGDRTLGLDFINASDQSILEYCYFSDALTSGIHLDNSNITVRNCTIENSEAPTGVDGGGAIEILNGSDALIENNTLVDNYSTGYGGAIYVDDSSPIITGNTITDNIAGYYGSAGGGGIAVFGNSNPEITFNNISDNSANPSSNFFVNKGYGGGIDYAGGSDGLIAGNMIVGNIVDWEPQTETYGGGLYIYSASPRVENNLIAYNQAQSNDGGGIFMYNSNSVFTNNTISHNEAGDFGGAVYSQNSNPAFINSILYFNQDSTGSEIWTENSDVTVSYSDIQGGWQGEGNIDTDPFFRDALNRDFHLSFTDCGDDYDSPAIDAGDPTISDEVLGCQFGLGTEISDMGAYGGGQGNPTGINDSAGGIFPQLFELAQNYPNPFNGATTISFNLSVSSDVDIEIYDVLGRSVERVDLGVLQPGHNSYTWQANGYPSGTYFYRLQADGQTETRKMTYLK